MRPKTSDWILRIAKLPVSWFAGSGRRARLLILTYHRVLARPDLLMPNAPDADSFRTQMQFVGRYFRSFTVSEALDRLREGRLPSRSVCVSFDDGYANNASVAAPILQECGVKGTFYVTTGYLNGGVMWNDRLIGAIRALQPGSHDLGRFGRHTLLSEDDKARLASEVRAAMKYLAPDEREEYTVTLAGHAGIRDADFAATMMSDEMVCGLDDAGMEIGAHTVSHPILSALDEEDARQEIRNSKAYLERLLGHPVRSFAYPNGRFKQDFDQREIGLVRAAGFDYAVTTEFGAATRESDPHAVPRAGLAGTNPYRSMLRMARMYRRRDALAALR